LNLIIPKYFGGFGLNFQEYQHCIAQLAQGCSATAVFLNMHCIIMGALADINYDKLTKEQKTIDCSLC
jgi:alkylation response protein AidB-like acyl-CoA dehydrogenase